MTYNVMPHWSRYRAMSEKCFIDIFCVALNLICLSYLGYLTTCTSSAAFSVGVFLLSRLTEPAIMWNGMSRCVILEKAMWTYQIDWCFGSWLLSPDGQDLSHLYNHSQTRALTQERNNGIREIKLSVEYAFSHVNHCPLCTPTCFVLCSHPMP